MKENKLKQVFSDNAKTYVVMPVRAMKYVKGLETGYIVHFEALHGGVWYEGLKLFECESEAEAYIHENNRQQIQSDNAVIYVDVKYDSPQPVIHGAASRHEALYEHSFISDESKLYNILFLNGDTWVVQDFMGHFRTWNNSCLDFNESLFEDVMIAYEAPACDKEQDGRNPTYL